ncbi:quinone-dependent dihydroorotate dehydrogenase [Helicobacter sp. 11-8110]|uniref:quinone-dependent dihydroorotate dehydrogenase n=1 Tax=Helicobacter sp. 11-8110 TaxID=2004997 RepID=UPI000DCBE318|nr:quinone-dependent dihydroorotate dehydrogenase [Helicobacter sp. 11-8110]RAX52590.1 dihydroorotate dehydrogenase (quinone) [Helicobacter sp. 11-8110]
MFSYHSIRPYIFKSDPEKAHSFVEKMAKLAPKIPGVLPLFSQKTCLQNPILAQKIDGISFYNPVGLAAGFDKNATMIPALCALGFSHLELGAVTPNPQEGNEKPRLWRHIQEESIQNAMGFNNEGAEMVATRLDKLYPFAIPLGMNIGKNKITPQEKALDDYLLLAKRFVNCTDYLSVNISSPNTPNLRDLQNETFIKELFLKLCEIYSKPIYLKIAPDLEIDSILKLTEVAIQNGAKGIIATNTTLDYSLVSNPKEKGGLSGRVLTQKSKEILKQIAKVYAKKITLISVGGISSAQEAFERIAFGANLVQIYSALIFEGPMLVKKINEELTQILESKGFLNIQDAVGINL